MNKKINLGLGIIFGILLLANVVSSAGIVSPYWKDYPLEMSYGETKIVNFVLQNMVGNQDITVNVKLVQGSEIATLENMDTGYLYNEKNISIVSNLLVQNKQYDMAINLFLGAIKNNYSGGKDKIITPFYHNELGKLYLLEGKDDLAQEAFAIAKTALFQ